MDIAKYDGISKAAILLISLGPEKAAKIFKYLREDEIEELTLKIATMGPVMPKVKDQINEEFYQMCRAQEYISEGGINYAKQLLEKAIGSEKAFEIINRLTVSLQVRPFEFISRADNGQVVNYIQNESSQMIALILSYLKPGQAGSIISALPIEKQAEVAKRIALMDRSNPEAINEVEKQLEKKISSLFTSEHIEVGGVDSIVSILNSVDRSTERNILETFELEESELLEEIKKKMFVFEDILSLDNRTIQTILRQDIDNRELAVALKGASQELQELIFANLSKRLAAMIREDMEFMGPIRRTDVEEAQQKIVNIIRKLQDNGDIIIARGGGDDMIV